MMIYYLYNRTKIRSIKTIFINTAGKVNLKFFSLNNKYTKINDVISRKIKNAQGSVAAKLKGTKKISIENNNLTNIIRMLYP